MRMFDSPINQTSLTTTPATLHSLFNDTISTNTRDANHFHFLCRSIKENEF